MGGVVHLRSVGPFRDAAPAILAAIAKQERMLAGLGCAKAPGKMPGRPRLRCGLSACWRRERKV